MMEISFLQFTPLIAIACAVAMVVLRASGSRVFFDVVGTFQANKMLTDAGATATVLESLYMDSLMAIQEAGSEIAQMFDFVDEVIPLAVEIENARVEFEKFVDNIDEARALEDQIEAIGLSFGFAADEAFEAGARMAQLSGVLGGQGSTAVGTEMGMLFGAISGMGTEAAMQRLINLNQQTKFMTENIEEGMEAEEKSNIIRRDTIKVLDQLNTVENRSAATMSQITFVMNQFASQAHLTNESIAAMAAMSATLIEAGEEQGKGGRALRMIYARLGADTNGARTTIENLGIAVTDAEGDMRPFSHILQNLAEHYRTLNGEQQQQLAQAVAGNRHYTRLIKLLENVDRVRELELEAMLAQFPARDELQRRLDSEVFQYERAQAAVKNYQGALGNALLPSMTAVVEQQALFNQTLAGLAETPIFGNIIGGFTMMSRLMGNFIGPTAQSIIAIKNLSIAMQTQTLVARALRGEQIAGNKSKEVMGLLTDVEIYKTKEKIAVLEEEKAKLHEKANTQQIEKLNTENSARSQGQYSRHLKTTMAALDAVIAKIKELSASLEENEQEVIQNSAATEILGNTTLQASMSMTRLSIGLGALGSAAMMFADSEKGMRRGMMLTTAAMGVQMYSIWKTTAAMAAQRREQMLGTTTTEVQTWTLRKATMGMLGYGGATEKAAWATFKLDKGIKAMAAKTLVLLGVFIAFEKILDKLGAFKAPDMTGIDELNTTVADTGLVLEYLGKSEEEVNSILEEQIRIINGVGDATDSASQRLLQAATPKRDAAQEVLDMYALEKIAINENKDAIWEFIEAKKTLDDLDKDKAGWGDDIAKGFEWAIEGLHDLAVWTGRGVGLLPEDGMLPGDDTFLTNFLTGDRIGDRNKALRLIEDFGVDFVELNEWMTGRTFETWEEFEDAFTDFINVTKNPPGADDMFGSITGGLQDANDEIYKFNNAREELFFGFAASNLTGDLVRQVHQQGVETLVTTTEVIMNNQFNGMTTEEVADEILDQIINGGLRNGYNFATTG